MVRGFFVDPFDLGASACCKSRHVGNGGAQVFWSVRVKYCGRGWPKASSAMMKLLCIAAAAIAMAVWGVPERCALARGLARLSIVDSSSG